MKKIIKVDTSLGVFIFALAAILGGAIMALALVEILFGYFVTLLLLIAIALSTFINVKLTVATSTDCNEDEAKNDK
ncbi:MAG: hypothetical protein HYR95_01150 [Candidatus Colwellbacteria bacterium]|nr:hypothetical protein [Candidatus Colwellbacteria bacterium]